MGHPAFGLQYLFGIINKFHPIPSTAETAQWVRHWATDHRVVQLVDSNPSGGILQIRFSNLFLSQFYARPSELQ